MTTTPTVKDFVNSRPFVINLTRVPENPNFHNDKKNEMIHWHFVISYKGKDMAGYFSTGTGWVEKRTGKTTETENDMGYVQKVVIWENAPEAYWSEKHDDFIVRENGKHYAARQLNKFVGQYRIKKPTVADVLECYKMDSGAEHQSFDDWAADLGYDTDSIKAKQTYEACQKEARDLRNLLGSEHAEFMLTNND